MSGDKYRRRSVQHTRKIFAVFLEHFRDNLTACPVPHFFLIHAVLDRFRSRSFIILDMMEINSGDFTNEVCHVDSLPRRCYIEFLALILENRRSVHSHRCLVDNLFGYLNHQLHIAIRRVAFHGCEFRIVISVHALVTEHLAHFIYSVEAADDQSL